MSMSTAFRFCFSRNLNRSTSSSFPNCQNKLEGQINNAGQIDAEEVADKVKNHPVSDSLLFGELWRTRIRGQLVSTEEGVFKHWYSGRMVLAGDAVHKV